MIVNLCRHFIQSVESERIKHLTKLQEQYLSRNMMLCLWLIVVIGVSRSSHKSHNSHTSYTRVCTKRIRYNFFFSLFGYVCGGWWWNKWTVKYDKWAWEMCTFMGFCCHFNIGWRTTFATRYSRRKEKTVFFGDSYFDSRCCCCSLQMIT